MAVPPRVTVTSSTTVADGARLVISAEDVIDREPMTDERHAQINMEVDEFYARREAFQREGQFRGRHILDWMPELDRLRTEKRDDEALVILAEIAPVTDRAYRALGEKIGGWAEMRIAVIYRRRKMLADEVAVLADFIEQHPDHEAREMRARLVKAREILARSDKASMLKPTTGGAP